MLGAEAKALIIKNLPNKVTVQGHSINTFKRYANQYTYEQFPAITLEYDKMMTKLAGSLDDFSRVLDHTKQPLTYTTGTNTYTLDISFVLRIDEVVGKVSGVDYIFLPEEYEMSGGTPPFYTQIHFKGPTYPDTGTTAYVTYHHAWIRRYVGGCFIDDLTINIWAKDVEVDKPGGKKEYLNGILIADQLAEDVWKWLNYDAEEVELPSPFSIRNISEVVVLDSQMVGEEIRRRQITMEVVYVNEWERTMQETIETTEQEVTINQ